MVQEAEIRGEDDKRKRKVAESRNRAESLIRNVEGALEEFGERLGVDDKDEIEADLEELRDAMEGEDLARIQTAIDRLNQSAHRIAEAIYQ